MKKDQTRCLMKMIWTVLILVSLSACSQQEPSSTTKNSANTAPATEYQRKLLATKAHYPFKKQSWRSSSRFVAIFDVLIAELIAAGEHAPDAGKVAIVRRAVTALNDLHRQDHTLIETGEAGQLCELLGRVGVAAGIPTSKFPSEEGAASGRDW